MAAELTERFKIYTWASDSDQFTRNHMKVSHDNIDALGAGFLALDSDLPAPAAENARFFHLSTSGVLSVSDGSNWRVVGSLGDTISELDGTSSSGVSSKGAREDHKHSLAAKSISTAKLADGAVTNDKLASNISASKLTGTLPLSLISDGSLSGKLAAGAVGTTEITDGAVSNAKLASGIDGAKIQAGSIPTDRLDGNIDVGDLADASAYSVLGNTAGTAAGVSSIVSSANTVLRRGSTNNLGFGQITTEMIENDAVENTKLANLAGYSLLGRSEQDTATPHAVGPIAEWELVGREAWDGTVNSANLKSVKVGTNHISDRAVTSGKILSVAGSKITGSLPDNIVTTDAISSGAVTSAKISGRLALAQLPEGVATSILARAGTSSGSFSNLQATNNSVLRRGTGNLGFGKITLGTHTDGSYVSSLTGGTNISVSASSGSVTVNHDTMTAPTASSDANNGKAITTLTISNGHVTDYTYYDFDSRFSSKDQSYGDSSAKAGRRIFIQSGAPTGANGDLWFQT